MAASETRRTGVVGVAGRDSEVHSLRHSGVGFRCCQNARSSCSSVFTATQRAVGVKRLFALCVRIAEKRGKSLAWGGGRAAPGNAVSSVLPHNSRPRDGARSPRRCPTLPARCCRCRIYNIPAPGSPLRAAFSHLSKDTRTLQHILELRVYVDNKGLAGLCSQ